MVRPTAAKLIRSGGLWALVASATGVAFGLLRELLIVKQLGFTTVNDQLQTYLSVIYGVSLLNETVRLVSLNLLQTKSLAATAKSILPVGLLFAVGATGLMAFLLKPQSVLLLVGAGISGWLNMVMVMLVMAKQRAGSFWSAHWINLLPNFLLIPGILVVWSMHLPDPVPALAVLYYLLPVVQIFLLLFVKSPSEAKDDSPAGREAGGLILAHGSSAVGGLVFQGVLRSTGLQTGSGVLSLLSIAIRMYDSIRFILVDTVIGRKLARWKEGTDLGEAVRWMQKLVWPQAAVVAIGVLMCLVGGPLWGKHGYLALIVLVFSIGSFGLRVVYYMVNSLTVSNKVVWTYGLQDAGVAGLLWVLASLGWVWPEVLVLAWYLVKPLGQLITLMGSIKKMAALPMAEEI